MIYFYGDLHGDERREMIPLIEYEKAHHFNENDLLIICGDFGFIWNYEGRTFRETFILNKIKEHSKLCLDYFESAPWTTVFVDGNHECFPKIYDYPVKEWCGGLVHEIRPTVYHLQRGELYTFGGKTLFAMGGAMSTDVETRVEGKSWWKEELPNEEEYAHAKETLSKVSHVNYIVTHCAPAHIEDTYMPRAHNQLTEFLEKEVNQKIDFDHWYFGHYHFTRDFEDKYTCLYKEVRPES